MKTLCKALKEKLFRKLQIPGKLDYADWLEFKYTSSYGWTAFKTGHYTLCQSLNIRKKSFVVYIKIVFQHTFLLEFWLFLIKTFSLFDTTACPYLTFYFSLQVMFKMLQKDHLHNPLIPRSNCQIISLYNITSESDSKVMWIKEVVPD